MSYEGWKEYKLGEIAKDISYGYTESASNEKIGPKFLRITDIVQGLKWETVPYCKIDSKIKNRYKLNVGDIVIARTGATTGTAEIIKEEVDAVFASYLIRIQINEKIADPFFIGYWVKSSFWKDYVQSIIGGSAQPGANAKQFAEFKVLLPELPTQHRVVSILSSLDDKIELNRQTNETLEAIAQALFKEWFVDFNFPGATGEMVESELGMIPKGWGVKNLGEIVEVRGGTTPSTKKVEYWDGEHFWVTPKDLSNLKTPILLSTERKITSEGVKQISSGILPEGTLLLSSRAPIGYLALTQMSVSINQGFIAIIGKEVSNVFMLFWLKENMSTIISRANGSTFLEISKSNFREIRAIVPDADLLSQYDNLVHPIMEQISSKEIEVLKLSTLRDILLPKLMQGKF